MKERKRDKKNGNKYGNGSINLNKSKILYHLVKRKNALKNVNFKEYYY
jgi:hypothetical protein